MRIPINWPAGKARGIFLSIWCLLPPLLALLVALIFVLLGFDHSYRQRLAGRMAVGRETGVSEMLDGPAPPGLGFQKAPVPTSGRAVRKRCGVRKDLFAETSTR